MAQNVTRLELRTRIRFAADMVNSTRASDADINTLINVHKAELFDHLVNAGPPDYYATTTPITTLAGTIGYALPADFRSLLGVYINDSSTRRREILELREGTFSSYDGPPGGVSLTLKYVPTATLFTDDANTLNGVSGWDELVVQLCARALRRRDNRDVSMFDMAIAEQRQRVMSNAPKRSQAGPRYINDVLSAEGDPYYSGSNGPNAWRLEGEFLNLYSASPGLP